LSTKTFGLRQRGIRIPWRQTGTGLTISIAAGADDEERVLLLGLVLENLGADVAVRLGDPAVWKAAVASLG
jgi:hypothetical protein